MMRALAAAAIFAAFVVSARPAHAGDPLRVWKTVETDHFVIYYWEPLDDVAHRVGVVAERAHRTLAPALDHVPSEKTLIFLADDTDAANGFATVLPRNAIQLYATGPNSFSELDDHDDWLYGLVAHEYTHILHLDTMEGLPTIYNSIFGKTWAPNQIMPRWLIEGIAVYEESKRSAGGRNRGTRFDQFIRIARKDGKELRLDEVSGSPRQFPRGNAVYVYGSHFLAYVFDRFGDDALRAMAHISGAWPIPFAVNRQIAKVVGKPFTELYDDWMKYLRDKYALQEQAAERRGLRTGRSLTHSAEVNLYPHYSADSTQLVWLQSDGYTLEHVRAIPLCARAGVAPAAGEHCGDASFAREVAQIDDLGPFDLLTDGSFVYEQGRQFRRDYSFEDLFRYDLATGQTVRLTTGRRARDPAVSLDGRRVAYSENRHSESVLAVMDVAPEAEASVVWRGEPFDEAYQPAWSPDGTRLAFSAWRRGGYRDILIVDIASGKIDEVTHDRAIDMAPAWSRDGQTLYFDSDRTGISNIYAFDLRDRSLWQVTNVLGGAFEAAPSPDGTRLAYAGAVPAGGYDIFELAVDRAAWTPAPAYLDDKPPAIEITDSEAKVSAPRPYRALETLAPQTWTGTLDATTHTASLTTSGSDAVGLHSYVLGLGMDLDTGDANVGASYSYSGWRQGFAVAGSRTVLERGGWRIDGVNRAYREEDWSGVVSIGLPVELRPSSSWSASVQYNADYYRLVTPPTTMIDPNQRVPVPAVTDYFQSGLSTRVGYSHVHATTFSMGPIDGIDGVASLRIDHPALGARYRNVTLAYSGDAYLKLWGKTPVLALRVVGALRAGDLLRPGSYGLGGVPAQDVVNSIVYSTRTAPIGYLHGFPARTVVGNQYHLANLEYRQELWQIEHGLATLPIYLRRLNLALLSDLGTAFDTTFDASRNVRWSTGAALRLDAFFGYFVPGTFEIGYARGINAGGLSETWLLLTSSL